MTDAGGKDPLASLLRQLEREAPGMSEAMSPRRGRLFPDAYFATSQWALQPIRLALLAARRDRVGRILDLPCGYGRVMRAIRAEFPEAHITACDIDPHAVDFCAETFGATPVYSREDPGEIEIHGPFDLIWCGSLFTHLDKALWTGFLQLFESLLEPGGVLVFTTCGRFAAEARLPHVGHPGLSEEEVERILRDYRSDGFGYCGFTLTDERRRETSLPAGYGLAVAAPWWTCARLQEDAPGLDLLSYTAGGSGDRWGDDRPANGLNGQDFVACIRIEDEVLRR